MMTFRKYLRRGLMAVPFLFATVGPVYADGYYTGRSIRIIVGSGPGGSYDLYARLVARHLGRHILGSPTVTVSNMPGASGVEAANYLFNLAAKDGTVLGTFNKSMPFYELVGQSGIRFKSKEFTWIGCLSQTEDVVAVWHTTGVRSVEEARKRPIIMGALSKIGTMWTYPALLNAELGTQFTIVTGYASGTSVNHAMELGEIEGRGSNPWTSWKATQPEWVRDKKIVPILQIGLHKDPDLPHVPLLVDLASNEEQRLLFRLVSNSAAIDHPIVAPPRLAPDVRQILNEAFALMVRNADFLGDAKERALDLDPLSGEDLASVIRQIIDTPSEIVSQIQKLTK